MTKLHFTTFKKIYDSLHGFIRLTELEKELIDTLPFQRLHFIRQLGTAYLAYPGATHTRFEHSIGAMHIASSIYNKLLENSAKYFPSAEKEIVYWHAILRLAALCHDLGHPPFSHAAERELLGKNGHEIWSLKIIESEYLDATFNRLQTSDLLPKNHRVKDDVIKIAIGEERLKNLNHTSGENFSNWERILSQIICGDFFGADRIDYLLRDSKNTGIAHGTFDHLQLQESLCILPSSTKNLEELGIEEGGIEACEALFLARHFMHRRVYQYPSVKAYAFHLKNFIKAFLKGGFSNIEQFLQINDAHVICALIEAANNPSHAGHLDAKKIITRKHPYKAIAIPKKFPEKKLKEFKEKNATSMFWELNCYSEVSKIELSFPVIKKSGEIKRADQCSKLLSSFIDPATDWVYIEPKFELSFLKYLESK